MRNTTEDNVAVTVVVEIVTVETRKREDIQTIKIGVDKDEIVEEVIVLIVKMLNVTIVKNMDIT